MLAATIRSPTRSPWSAARRAAHIQGWGGEDVRMTDLFFKGGETIRGFERAGYGPRDACEDPTHRQAYRPLHARTPSAVKLFWATTAEVRFPFPSFPTVSACRAPSSSTPVRCGIRADMRLSGRCRRGQLHLRQRRDAPVDRIQHHLAIAARPAPRRHRPGPAQGRFRQDGTLPLRRFDELLKEAISRYALRVMS